MTTYFSVDVETTGPFPEFGDLLSVGVCTLNGRNDNHHFEESIYHRVLKCDLNTLNWWRTIENERWNEATVSSRSPFFVAHSLNRYVEDQQPEVKQRCFVANPASFDFSWINWLFLSTGIKNPFGHRSLCLRSMHFGLTNSEWGGERSTWGDFEVKPEKPHNCLSDAIAQREELKLLLEERSHLLAGN